MLPRAKALLLVDRSKIDCDGHPWRGIEVQTWVDTRWMLVPWWYLGVSEAAAENDLGTVSLAITNTKASHQATSHS